MKRYPEQINPVHWIRNTMFFQGIHCTREFASILNRERDRADRTGQEFSLVIFDVANNNGNSASARRLVPILKHRIRSTDDIGWLEDGRIGVVLPHTRTDSAWKFVFNVRQACNGDFGPLDCIIYAYPSCWPSGTDEVPPRNVSSRKSVPPQHDPGSSEMRSSGVEDADGTRSLKELESQFLCGIPFWKRTIDIVGSLFALILLIPLFLLVALLIKFVSPGPILFRQQRVGFLGKTFTIWKFRTMHVNADTTVHQQYLRELINNEKSMVKLDNGKDIRIIPFGKVLRAAGIDELPQLLNVLLGDMSLVGPRPCIPYEAREFHHWHMRRFDTIPGLTGLWQVSGKNRTTFKEMMRLDIAYTKKRGFLLDMRIFLKTLPAIINQVVGRQVLADDRSKGLSAVPRMQ